jgi:hypothetical protein
MADVRSDDLPRERIGQQAGAEFGMKTDEAPVASRAEERLVPVDDMGGEAGPEEVPAIEREEAAQLDADAQVFKRDGETS